MNRVALLPDQVANQIAAGEVVERPVSVVKELVENALDAGASQIEVEILAGGRSLIRVTDDGMGMSREDALLCLERHATSKIQDADDLSRIGSFGFRGEALPSIASVSRFRMTTREREAEAPLATQVEVHGGTLTEVREAGHPWGTTVEVRQLFFNVPARRKFLRTIETERAHILHYLQLVALAHPEVALNYLQDKRSLLRLPAVREGLRWRRLRERWNQLPGTERHMIPLEYEDTRALSEAGGDGGGNLLIWGLVGAPGVSRSTRADLHFFVNRRPVDNRLLNHGLQEAYHTALMRGRFPVCCLFLELDPAEVDVNIHPAKREVKFQRGLAVQQRIIEAVRQALLDYHRELEGKSGSKAPPEQASEPPSAAPPPKPLPASQVLSSVRQDELPVRSDSPAPSRHEPPTRGESPPPREQGTKDIPGSPETGLPTESASDVPAGNTDTPPLSSRMAAMLEIPLRMVGIVGKIYAVLESDRGMVLLDQRAAHERVVYERILNRSAAAAPASQRLLLPETVELPPREAQLLKEHAHTLESMGVGVREFGDRTFLLDSLPASVRSTGARHFLLELVDGLVQSGGERPRTLDEQAIARAVSRQSVRSSDLLTGSELERLIADLRRCSMPYTSPSGRPTLIEMSFRELERRFEIPG